MGKDTDFNPSEFDTPDYRTHDPPSYACTGLVECIVCHRAHGYCNELSKVPYNEPSQGEEMIRRGTSDNGGGKRKRTGFRFLSADMLSSAHQLATIIDARMGPDSFRPNQESLVVKLKFKGEYLLWTLREGNPSLEALADNLGDDETKWKGIDIELFLEEDDFTGKKWMRANVVTTAAKKK